MRLSKLFSLKENVVARAIVKHRHGRPYATNGKHQNQDAKSRIDRVTSRLPRFLHRYVAPLRDAPVTHITSFLLLHELTAIVPLFGLAATFHYAQWLPPYISEGKLVSEGIEKFGNYFRKKGWLGEEDGGRDRWWSRGEGTTRLVVEFATAYAITKALLPLRLVVSVWGTPWFARTFVIPLTTLFRRAPKTAAPPTSSSISSVHVAAGTGASAGGVLPKTGGGASSKKQ